MVDPNPYQAPTDLDNDASSNPRRSQGLAFGIEFVADWSPEGLQQRRRTDWSRKYDLVFAFVTLLWIVSLLASLVNPFSSFFCLITPFWVLTSIGWFSHLTYRNGGAFHRRFPGLAGPVRGHIDRGLLRIEGPALSIMARTHDCITLRVSENQAMLQPPGIDTVLPIVGNDIRKSWTYEIFPANRSFEAAELLRELPPSDHQIRIHGKLRGQDLRGQPCYRNWIAVGAGGMLLAISLAAWAVYELMQLPSWILQPPSHYAFSDDDVNSLVFPVLLLCVSAFAGAFGIWHFAQLRRTFGRFTAWISPDRIAITRGRAVVGYHGEALNHFHWTSRGLVAGNAGGRDMFLLPASWFEAGQQRAARAWFDRKPQRTRKPYYIGPKI